MDNKVLNLDDLTLVKDEDQKRSEKWKKYSNPLTLEEVMEISHLDGKAKRRLRRSQERKLKHR